MTLLLAHQGGWDELLVFAAPVVLYALLRLWERRRGGRDGDGAAAHEADASRSSPGGEEAGPVERG